MRALNLPRDGVSKRIRDLRKEKATGESLTLEKWSEFFGTNRSGASKWERGTIPYRKTIDLIAQKSNVSSDWILYGELEEYLAKCVNFFPSLGIYFPNDEIVCELVTNFADRENNYPTLQEILFKLFEDYPSLIIDNKIYQDIIANKISPRQFTLRQIDENELLKINIVNLYIRNNKMLSLNESNEIIQSEMKKTGLNYPELIENLIKNLFRIEKTISSYTEINFNIRATIAKQLNLDLDKLKNEASAIDFD